MPTMVSNFLLAYWGENGTINTGVPKGVHVAVGSDQPITTPVGGGGDPDNIVHGAPLCRANRNCGRRQRYKPDHLRRPSSNQRDWRPPPWRRCLVRGLFDRR